MVAAALSLPPINAGRCCVRTLLARRYATAAGVAPGWGRRNPAEVKTIESARAIGGRLGRYCQRGQSKYVPPEEISRMLPVDRHGFCAPSYFLGCASTWLVTGE